MISPHSAAVVASMALPVSSISSARLRPTARTSSTIGVEQNRPMLTPGVAKVEASDASARSQAATSWQPAAVAMPSTCAITGLRSPPNVGHQVRTEIENAAVEINSPPRGHLFQVVPGAERRPFCVHNNDPYIRLRFKPIEGLDQSAHRRRRKRVAAPAVTQGDPAHGTVGLNAQRFFRHFAARISRVPQRR